MSKFVLSFGLFLVSAIMIASNVEGAPLDLKTEFINLITQLQKIVGDSSGRALKEFYNCYNGSKSYPLLLPGCATAARQVIGPQVQLANNDPTKHEQIIKLSRDYVNKIGEDYFRTWVPMGDLVVAWVVSSTLNTKITLNGDIVPIYGMKDLVAEGEKIES